MGREARANARMMPIDPRFTEASARAARVCLEKIFSAIDAQLSAALEELPEGAAARISIEAARGGLVELRRIMVDGMMRLAESEARKRGL
jgi:hypothetical protein